MKKTVYLTFAALVATATLAMAQEHKMPMPAKSAVNDTLMKYENELLQDFQKKDWTAFKKRIMPGAWAIDDNGPATVEDMLKTMSDPKANMTFNYKVSDMKVVD